MSLRTRLSVALLTLSLSAGTAMAADYAPVPKKAPREPVAKQNLVINQVSIPASRIVEGEAIVVDSEKLRIDNLEFRLFGIVPPQLSASHGPQARAALDKLTQNATTHCRIRDRASDSRLLATCTTSSGNDLALELLKRGLAVTARGSLMQSELASTYSAAEQTAQSQKIGLWSGVAPTPAPAPAATVAPPAPPTETAAAPQPSLQQNQNPIQGFGISGSPNGTTKSEVISASALLASAEKKAESPASDTLAATAESIIEANPDASEAPAISDAEIAPPSTLERYQLFFTGVLMLITALSVIFAVFIQKRIDKTEELKAIAAALRGELMAARAVCISRLHQIATARNDDKNAVAWPRIRAMVFQAHVGRIGWLGADLARQISSIYGLSSDYASYYHSHNNEGDKIDAEAKKIALQKLVSHIETVLPRLAKIENKKPSANILSYLIGRVRVIAPPSDTPPGNAIDVINENAEPLSLASPSFASTPDTFAAATEVTTTKTKSEDTAAPEEIDEEPVSDKPEDAPETETDKATEDRIKEAAPLKTKPVEIDTKPVETALKKLRKVKDYIQDKLTPPAIDTVIIDHDEYMAMLNAEAETFAMYDLNDADAPVEQPKKRKRV